MQTHFNTTNERGNSLKKAQDTAKSQQEKILKLFTRKQIALSASQVMHNLNLSCPITSVRRAMTNLKSAGLLQKTETKVKGMYGRSEYQYKLNS